MTYSNETISEMIQYYQMIVQFLYHENVRQDVFLRFLNILFYLLLYKIYIFRLLICAFEDDSISIPMIIRNMILCFLTEF